MTNEGPLSVLRAVKVVRDDKKVENHCFRAPLYLLLRPLYRSVRFN